MRDLAAFRIPQVYLIIKLSTLIFLISAHSAWAQDDAVADLFGFLLVFLATLGIYLIPSFVAFARAHPNRWAILVINMVFGATGLGWLGSLIWALNAVHRSPLGSNGGESGLNLFANDGLPRHTLHTEIWLGRLEKLKDLLDKGAINQEEYERLKQRLL